MDSRRFGIPQKIKAATIINGIPRTMSTKTAEIVRRTLFGATAIIPKIIPITIAIANEISVKLSVS